MAVGAGQAGTGELPVYHPWCQRILQKSIVYIGSAENRS